MRLEYTPRETARAVEHSEIESAVQQLELELELAQLSPQSNSDHNHKE